MSQNVSPLPTSTNPESAQSDATESELTQRQENTIDLLLKGGTDAAVAEAVGVCRRTLCRWKHEDPSFKSELRRRRDELNDEQADRLRHLLGKALDVMEEQLKNTYAPTCHRAARTLLTMCGVGKAVGIQGNVREPTPPSPSSDKPKSKPMSAATLRTLASAVHGIDFLGSRGSPVAT